MNNSDYGSYQTVVIGDGQLIEISGKELRGKDARFASGETFVWISLY